MSSYIWWAANQIAGKSITWVGTHPAEATFITAALANKATRGIALDVLKIVIKENVRSWTNITKGVGQSLVNRSRFIDNSVKITRQAGSKAAKTVGTAGRRFAKIPYAVPVTVALTGREVLEREGFYEEAAVDRERNVRDLKWWLSFPLRVFNTQRM